MQRLAYKYIIMWLLGMILFVSCQEDLFYSRYEHVNYEGWNCSDTLVFDIPQAETNKGLSLQLVARTTDSYEYNNIILKADVLADSLLVASDTIHINIYDKYGKTQGKGFPYTEVYSLPKTMTLKAKKNYQIRITHSMRLNPLPNISEIGILLNDPKAKHQLY